MTSKKSPLEWSPEEMAQHVGSVREAVELFIKTSGEGSRFSDLVEFMNKRFRTADEQMFKEWTEKEFPGKLTYSHTHTETFDVNVLDYTVESNCTSPRYAGVYAASKHIYLVI